MLQAGIRFDGVYLVLASELFWDKLLNDNYYFRYWLYASLAHQKPLNLYCWECGIMGIYSHARVKVTDLVSSTNSTTPEIIPTAVNNNSEPGKVSICFCGLCSRGNFYILFRLYDWW